MPQLNVRTRPRRARLVLLLTLCFASLGLAPAQAGIAGDDPDWWNLLTPEMQADLTPDHYEVTSSETEPVEVAATSNATQTEYCKSVSLTVRALNALDGGLYSYTQTVPWCWVVKDLSGGGQTSYISHSGPAIVTATTEKIFWRYDGIVDQQKSTATNSQHWYYVQGEFSLCFGPWCVQHTYPWIDIMVQAWGRVVADGYPGVG